MDRRALLKLIAATALAGCNSRDGSAQGLKVVVAGAGIIGASIAYHLAKAGASVTVIDKKGPATHASRGTFAWINATWAKQPQSYHAFSQSSVANWGDLAQTLELPVRWGGSLEWFDDNEREVRLAAQIDEQIAWGEPARMLDANEFAELEPNVVFPANTKAAYSPNDGTADPILATQALLAAAERLGAVVRFPCELTDASFAESRLTSVETSQGSIAADRLVLATGAAPEIPRHIGMIDIPQRSTPGVIAITQPAPRRLQRIIGAPGVHMHQRDDGRIVLGEQDGAPQNEAHALRLEGRPNDFPSTEFAQLHAARMLAVAEQFSPGIAETRVDQVYIGWRPLPIDGHPVIGASPHRSDVYIAIMHSGVTLAPIVGQLVTHELTEDVVVERLSNYRPDREFEQIKRY
ncbi:MAG: NAD(P)/FAD-dependent oxidoreductase [Woeseiaceae bacterium]